MRTNSILNKGFFLYTRKLSYEHLTPAFYSKITSENQNKKTNSIDDFVHKNLFRTFVLQISDTQKNVTKIFWDELN